MKTVTLPSGEVIPAFGLGTWKMGEQRSAAPPRSLHCAVASTSAQRLIDTAEMYAEGGAEEVVGEAVKGRRDGVFIVSKVYPHNASAKGTLEACERSLQAARHRPDRSLPAALARLGPLGETVGAFEALRKSGKIRHWGVSNFDSVRHAGTRSDRRWRQLRDEPGAVSPR